METFLPNITKTDDAQAIQSILLTEDNYKIIFNNSAVAITVTDADENIVVWNKFAETLLGRGYDDLFLKPVKQLYPEEEWQRIRSEHIRQKGMHHHMETRIITPGNEVIEVELSISVLKGAEGSIQGSIGIIRDISEKKKAERALQESMELSRGMIETAAAAIFLLNEGKITFANHVMEEITGYSSEELVGMSPLELIHPEHRKEAQENGQYTTGTKIDTPAEFRIIRKDLETNWVTERLTIISHKGKNHVLGNWTDITEWKIAQEMSRYHAQQTELLLKVGATAGQTLNLRDIVENFLDGITQLLHDRPVAFFLLTQDSRNLELVSHRLFSDDFVKRMSRIKVGKGFIGRVALTGLSLVLSPTYYDPRFDPSVLERDNLWSLCSVPVFARDQIKGVICIGSRDQRHSLEEETQLFELISSQIGVAIDHAMLYEKTVEMAFTDGLTGLYNRRYLFEELNRELSRATRNNTSFAVINMDVDNFKTINDRFGHDHGDRMLKEFSEILKKFSRKSDVAARMGGDEFILLTPECDYIQASAIAQRILTDANAQKFDLKSEKVSLHASIGVAGFPTHGTTIDEILTKSDKAMYEAKKAGKNQIKVAAV